MIRIVRETTVKSEEWIVKRHTREHNHSLLSREEISLLRAFRFICPEDGDRIKLLKRAGLKISDILNVLRLEKGEALSFNSRDVRNLLSKEFVGSGDQGSAHDVGDLLKILKEKYERDSKFFYDFTVDEMGVWRILFGFPEMQNRWQVFLTMWLCSIRLTGSIDQDRAMKDAISTELPDTKHGFCFWHITQKFSSWFNNKLGEEFQIFMKEFFLMLEVETATEFEALWFTIIERHSLQDDRHIKELFDLRKYWCPVYLSSYFFAGMASTQRSESLNSLMDFFMSAQTQLHEFIDAFDQVIGSRIEAEKMATLRDKLGTFRSVTSTKFEEQAYSALTGYAFNLFRKQLVLSLEYVIHGEKVSHHQHVETKRTISWVPQTQTIHCSCLSFEYTGILCRHALRALVHFNVTELPEKYLQRRWCREVCLESVKKYTSPPISEDEK
ncbi:hypothetical protein R1sor_013398 [Riccia sorocarpa]|uniref:Protein FAR1-RELATED SEQUENCE n=1 Tax=Riccia sorocarpa TaxID=122646 RepID=A0ABD3H988_9MARC